MFRRPPSSITLKDSDFDEFDELKRAYEEEKAKQAAAEKHSGEREMLLERTIAHDNAKGKSTKKDNPPEASSSSSRMTYVSKRRRVAAADKQAAIRSRLGINDKK